MVTEDQIIAAVKSHIAERRSFTPDQGWWHRIWLNTNQKKISDESYDELSRQQTEWAKKHAYQASAGDKNRNLSTLINYGDYHITDDDNRKMQGQITFDKVKDEVRKKYIQKFNETQWKDIQEKCQQRASEFDPQKILPQLFERHPWLRQELMNSSYATKCLAWSFFVEELIPRLMLAREVTLINSEYFWFESMTQAIENAIEGFPLSRFYKLYERDEEYCWSRPLPSLRNIHKRVVDYNQWLNQAFTRLDMYHYLYRTHPITMFMADPQSANFDTRLIDGIATPQVAAFHLSELDKLSDKRLNYMHYMLVNIESEDKPLWVCLRRQEANWIAYLPPELEGVNTPEHFSKLLSEYPQIKFKINIEVVNCKNNIAQNNIEGLDERVRWHAVLLSRVLEFCKQDNCKDINKFRQNVPATTLLEQAIRPALSVKNTEFKKKFTRAFVARTPITTNTLQRLIPHTAGWGEPNYPAGTQVLSDTAAEYLSINDKTQKLLDAFDNNDLELLTYAGDPNSLPIDSLQCFDRSYDGSEYELWMMHEILIHNYNINTLMLRTTTKPAKIVHVDDDGDTDLQLETNKKNDLAFFSFNPNLLTVLPDAKARLPLSDDTLLATAMHTAARNRFLNSALDKEEAKELQSVAKRRMLWQIAGIELIKFYQTHGNKINLVVVEPMLKHKYGWEKDYYNHRLRPKETELQVAWQLAQIAQMGKQGLDALFDQILVGYIKVWDEILKQPAPNLDAVFDLTGGLNDRPEAYANHLKSKLSMLSGTKCRPIFKSLSFILPKQLAAVRQQLFEILEILNQQKQTLVDNVGEIKLYNLDISNVAECDAIFKELYFKAQNKTNPLCIIVRIPSLDQPTVMTPTERSLKEKYMMLQNIILENQRQARLPQLNIATSKIYSCADNKLSTKAQLRHSQFLDPQSWDGADVLYPLAAQTLGIQQQFMKESSQEQELGQDLHIEQATEETNTTNINTYPHLESQLITRDNIDNDENCKAMWNRIPQAVKDLLGFKPGEKLSTLFSKWVGSFCNATNVIAKIEQRAIHKLMQHAPLFRLGISYDSLPPGFSLAFSKEDNSLILCYDEKREKAELFARSMQVAHKRNPFTTIIYEPQRPVTFRGDYRQYQALAKDDDKSDNLKKILWKHLATEDNDTTFNAHAKDTLSKLNNQVADEDVSVQLQQYNLSERIDAPPKGHTECLNRLKGLVDQKLQQINKLNNSELLNALFDPSSDCHLTPQNLRALGQLLYHHEVNVIADSEKNASDHFFFIAQQIYHNFGRVAFVTWKKYLIDTSQNLTECLTQEEVDALADSISVLAYSSSPKSYSEIWWQLLNVHGEATGAVRYAPLWSSYQRLIEYLAKRNLTLNKDLMFKYLSEHKDFNAQVFLDRLYSVLKSSQSSIVVKQQILNNIDKIDWTHSGYFYATRYENYKFWDESLQLSLFRHPADPKQPSYTPVLNATNPIATRPLESKTEVVSISLTDEQMLIQNQRFVASCISVTIEQYQQFKQLISVCFTQPAKELVSRLLLVSYANGINRLQNLALDMPALKKMIVAISSYQNLQLLAWLNQQVDLDKAVVPNSWQLKFEHIPDLLYAIEKANLQHDLLKMPPTQAREFIKSCGRVLQCYYNPAINSELLTNPSELLIQLLNFMQQQHLPWNHLVFTTTPWLLLKRDKQYDHAALSLLFDSGHKQLSTLRDQLAGINLQSSLYLPSGDELLTVAYEITNTKSNPRDVRNEFINRLTAKNCVVPSQDQDFRELQHLELTRAHQGLDAFLKDNYKSLNLAICKDFFNNYIAIGTTGEPLSKIEDLLKILAEIDSKPYYNELGQVLGLLIQKAKVGNRRYCLEQLTQWLKLLIPLQSQTQHFPVNILSEILSAQDVLAVNSSLLNNNLQALSSTITPHELVDDVAKIVKLEDINNKYKHILIKLTLQFGYDAFAQVAKTKIANVDALHTQDKLPITKQWLDAIISIINLIITTPEIVALKMTLLNAVTLTPAEMGLKDDAVGPALKIIWQKSQIKLVELFKVYVKDTQARDILFSLITKHGSAKDALINSIILLSINSKKDNLASEQVLSEIENLRKSLNTHSLDSLKTLSRYFNIQPIPRLKVLNSLLTSSNVSADQIILRYETELQATEEDIPKRSYSISDSDKHELSRIVTGIKRKGQGYIGPHEQNKLLNMLFYLNNYSQYKDLATIPFEQLKKELIEARAVVSSAKAKTDVKNFASARMLACLREILLRKSGKWVNHTQMLDLIFAALNKDDGLLHQIKTGQGKSIITFMRAAYLALNGYVVDVFSAKESLSKRDYDEFSYILDSIGIPTSYITPESSATSYHTNTDPLAIGAVNYATIGSFSLFISKNAWQNSKNIEVEPLEKLTKIELDRELRVAFLDECDHVLRDEVTQFNLSDSNDKREVYNLDEWVYHSVYQFYVNNKERFEQQNLKVSRNFDLRLLCEKLQQDSVMSPTESTFMQRIMIPALTKDPKLIIKRDAELKRLILAAHIAFNLPQDIAYSIQVGQRMLKNEVIIDARAAGVVINNQLNLGSTYSDLVQQMLHVHQNFQAAQRGEAPNFFVEPESQIVLSSNSKSLLNKYYTKIEGCSGTVGNKQDLADYAKSFGITTVIKLPTHEENQTVFVETIYCDNAAKQAEEIAIVLGRYNKHPSLITCEDDVHVKQIAKNTITHLGQNTRTLIVDTNSSGKSEREILPYVGKKDSVTFSSRMSRGTDIELDTNNGLLLIRSYPTTAGFRKQEEGRQGRRGAKGILIEIIDYGKVLADYKSLKNSPFSNRLEEIEKNEYVHLKQKLEKGSKKLHWLQGDVEKQRKYLIERSVTFLKDEINKNNQHYLRLKEQLISTLSTEISELLRKNYNNIYFSHLKLRTGWLECYNKIRQRWDSRLADKERDDSVVYEEFIRDARGFWNEFCQSMLHHKQILNSDIPQLRPAQSLEAHEKNKKRDFEVTSSSNVSESRLKKEAEENQDLPSLIALYQSWCMEGEKCYFGKTRASVEIINLIYGENNDNLAKLFDSLYNASVASELIPRRQLIAKLAQLDKAKFTLISTLELSKAIAELTDKFNNVSYSNHLTIFTTFFANKWLTRFDNPRTCTANDLLKINLIFKITREMGNHNVTSSSGNTADLTMQIAELLGTKFWNILDDELANSIITLFASKDANVASMLANRDLQPMIADLIAMLNTNKNSISNVEELSKYLSAHASFLNDNLNLVRPVFQLALIKHSDAALVSYIPKPQQILGDTKKQRASYMWFLTQRSPLKQNEYENLIKRIIELASIFPGFKDQLLSHLIALPPYVTLEYISQALASVTTAEQVTAKLSQISDAAQTFNSFLHSRDIVKSEKITAQLSEQDKELYDFYLAIFNGKSAAENAIFFKRINSYSRVPHSVIKIIIKLWGRNKLSAVDLQKTLDLVAKVNELPENCRKLLLEQFVNECEHLIGQTDFAQQYMTFTDTLHNHVKLIHASQLSLTDYEMSLLYTLYLQKKITEPQLQEAVPALQQIAASYTNFTPDSRIHEAIKAQFISDSAPDFASMLSDNKKFLAKIDKYYLPYATIETLKLACLHKIIQNEEQLDNCLMTISEAMQANATGSLGEYFNTPTARIKLVQYILLNLINIDKDFNQHCYTEYHRFLVRSMSAIAQKSSVKQERTQLIKEFKQLTEMAKEVKYLFLKHDANLVPVSHTLDATVTNHLRNFFKQQYKSYKDEYGVSFLRKEQAKKLFDKLAAMSIITTRDKYFNDILDIIAVAQDEILITDINTSRNAKGYSRLYDLTLHMTIEVARTLLADDKISMIEKAKLADHLQLRLDSLLALLSKRLKNQEYTVGVRDELLKIIKDENSIPSHLKYIVTHINCLVNLVGNFTINPLLPIEPLKPDFLKQADENVYEHKDHKHLQQPALTPAPKIMSEVTAQVTAQVTDVDPHRPVEELFKILDEVPEWKEISPQIPIFVSKEYIAQQLSAHVVQQDLPATIAIAADIVEAATTFSEFIDKLGREQAETNFKIFGNMFHANTPADNFMFFRLAKANSFLTVTELNLIWKLWNDNEKCNSNLSEIFDLFADINKLPTQCKHQLSTMFSELDLAKNDLAMVKSLLISYPEHDSDIAALYRIYKEKNLTANQFATALIAWQKLMKKAKPDEITKKQDVSLKSEFFNDLLNTTSQEFDRRIYFYNYVLSKTQDQELSYETFMSLKQSWLDNVIQGQNQLASAVDIILFFKNMNIEELQKYFTSPQNNRATRIILMQHLHHKILNLGTEFSERCYSMFQKLVSTSIKTPDLSVISSGSRLGQLQQRFRNLASFTNEMHCIILSLGTSHEEESNNLIEDNYSQLQQEFDLLFRNKQAEYDSLHWSTNRARKAQAARFFTELNEANRSSTSRQEYYTKVLVAIWTLQQKILTEDKDTTYNVKGYSRLYDISLQMTIEVTTKLLADDKITLSAKSNLTKQLDIQLRYNLDMLQERLPEGNTLKLQLCNNKDNLSGAIELINCAENEIPKHLKYLVTNINCLSEVVMPTDPPPTHNKM